MHIIVYLGNFYITFMLMADTFCLLSRLQYQYFISGISYALNKFLFSQFGLELKIRSFIMIRVMELESV
jgi:NhaP-type Na+/H+ or K+/H+ antiporter